MRTRASSKSHLTSYSKQQYFLRRFFLFFRGAVRAGGGGVAGERARQAGLNRLDFNVRLGARSREVCDNFHYVNIDRS
jgi:hypothetical protein